jgi:hypothetical protein
MTQIKRGDTGYIRPPANQLSPYTKAVVVSVDGENLRLRTKAGIVNVHRDWFYKAYILDAPQP